MFVIKYIQIAILNSKTVTIQLVINTVSATMFPFAMFIWSDLGSLIWQIPYLQLTKDRGWVGENYGAPFVQKQFKSRIFHLV